VLTPHQTFFGHQVKLQRVQHLYSLNFLIWSHQEKHFLKISFKGMYLPFTTKILFLNLHLLYPHINLIWLSSKKLPQSLFRLLKIQLYLYQWLQTWHSTIGPFSSHEIHLKHIFVFNIWGACLLDGFNVCSFWPCWVFCSSVLLPVCACFVCVASCCLHQRTCISWCQHRWLLFYFRLFKMFCHSVNFIFVTNKISLQSFPVAFII